MADIFVIFGGAFVALLCLVLVVGTLGSSNRSPVAKRAANLRKRIAKERMQGTGPGGTGTTSLKRDDARSRLPILDRLARRVLPRQAVLRQRLARTGKNIGVGSYLGISAGLAVICSLVLGFIVGLTPPLAVVVGLLVGAWLPHVVVGKMAQRRIARFTGLFPEAIDLIVRGLRSGLPVTESIAAVGQEMTEPLGSEFRRISESVKFGRSLEDSLWDTASRLDTADFKFFVISLSVQRETGGNLAETFSNLSEILRRRRQMKLKIKAMSSEARASAMILGSLPFVMFALIYLLNPAYEADLFTDPRGRMMLTAGLVVMGMGIAVMHKMVRFEI